MEDVEAEADEMGRFVHSKQQQRWLWHAYAFGGAKLYDHATGEVLAYVLSNHQDTAFLELKSLLEPFGIMQFYTDGWGAYAGVACRRHHGILIQPFIRWVRRTLKPLSASISPYAPELSDSLAKPFDFLSQSGYPMWSLDCLSYAFGGAKLYAMNVA